jgi:hypothetical protein
MLIRWAWETVELEKFPRHAQASLRRLNAGTFTVITLAFDTQLFVKRLTQGAYQLGLAQGSPWRSQAVAEMP